jgi:dihydrolipoamide dehydrogenase
MLVAVGRRPNSTGIGLDNTDVVVNEQGFVEVDASMRTADPAILAIGDLVGQPMLAHKGTREGIVAAEVVAGKRAAFDVQCIPAVVYTDPEIAWVGLTETDAKARGVNVEVARFPWAASGRATTFNRGDGVTKLLIEPETDRILGMGIAGVGAGELISEGALAIEMGCVASDLALTIHPHPTLSETLMEAGELVHGPSTHVYRPRKAAS